jgi:hypothetical protein
MIDLRCETLLTMAQAARIRPPGRGGKPTHPATVYRWVARGLRGHRLESIRLGGTLYTSREALQRFAEALTAETSPGRPASTAPTKVEEELTRLGI